jgi:type I restriction enzyme M protein
LAEFVELARTKPNSPKSWTVRVTDINTDTYDLTVRNPTAPEAAAIREPAVILDEIERLDDETRQIVNELRRILK